MEKNKRSNDTIEAYEAGFAAVEQTLYKTYDHLDDISEHLEDWADKICDKIENIDEHLEDWSEYESEFFGKNYHHPVVSYKKRKNVLFRFFSMIKKYFSNKWNGRKIKDSGRYNQCQ